MRITKREGILLIIVLVLGISFLFINYVYLPLKDDIEEMNNEYNELLDEEDAAKILQAQISSLKASLIDIETETKGVYDGMLDLWDQAENLVYMENLLDGLCDRIELNSYTPINVSSISATEVGITILTNYDNLKTILKNFENGKHYCTIENLDVTVENRDPLKVEWGPLDISANITVRFYAKSQSTDYPKEYDFITKDPDLLEIQFGKDLIFQ